MAQLTRHRHHGLQEAWRSGVYDLLDVAVLAAVGYAAADAAI